MESFGKERVIYEFGKFILNPQEKTLLADGSPVHLPAKEFETLLLFVENNGRALSKEEMMQTVWHDTFVEENNLAKNVSHLRKLLNSNGNTFIETLPKHGYRFQADVNQIVYPSGETILEKHTLQRLTLKVEEVEAEVKQITPQAKRKTSRYAIFASFGLAVLALIGLGALYWSKTNAPAKINSIAVLPLKPLAAEENNKALGLGLTDALITRLGTLRTVTVRPTSAVTKFANSEQDVIEIGKKLNVDAVLEGTIQQSDGRIRINARLLSVADGVQIWTERFDEPAKDIFALQDALSNKIAKTIAFNLKKSELAALASRPTENAEAYEKYLMGRFYQSQNTKQGLTQSIEWYEAAIALDPNFADAHAGVADANVLLYNFGSRSPNVVFPLVKQSLNRALQLNPNLSDAHLILAQMQSLYERDWQKAEESFQRALELNSNNANAYLRYGYFLTSRGRFDEALAKLEKARELNPLSSFVQLNVASVHLCRRDFSAAIEILNKITAENPTNAISFYFLAAAYEGIGEEEKSFDATVRALELEGGGKRAEELRAMKQTNGISAAYQVWFDRAVKGSKDNFVPAMHIAFLATQLKNREQTLIWLEKAVDERDSRLWSIKYYPRYDFVREDERFHRILHKIESKQN